MAGRNKGTPKTGGRKAGTRNRKTAELIKAVEATGITPLDYMLSVLRDEEKPESVRLQAARDSAPFIHSKLQSLEVETSVTTNHVVSSEPLNIDEWEAKYSTQQEGDQDKTCH